MTVIRQLRKALRRRTLSKCLTLICFARRGFLRFRVITKCSVTSTIRIWPIFSSLSKKWKLVVVNKAVHTLGVRISRLNLLEIKLRVAAILVFKMRKSNLLKISLRFVSLQLHLCHLVLKWRLILLEIRLKNNQQVDSEKTRWRFRKNSKTRTTKILCRLNLGFEVNKYIFKSK